MMRIPTIVLALLLLAIGSLAAQADSLYLLGRQQLNRADYAAAAGTFERLQLTTVGNRRNEAAYWRAFALYQVGDAASRGRAAGVLRELLARPAGRDAHPDVTALAARLGVGDTTIGCTSDDAADAESLTFLASRDRAAALAAARPLLIEGQACGDLARRSAVQVLAGSGTASDRSRLRALVRGDLPDAVRAEAVRGLQDDTARATLRLVEQVLRTGESTEMIYAAATVLARLDAPGTASRIRALLVDPAAPIVGRQSLLSMAARRGADDLPDTWLRELFDRLPSEGTSIRSTLVEVVAARGGRDNLEWIWQVASRPDAGALARLTALQRVGGRRSAGELESLFQRADSRLVQYGVIAALGGHSTSSAMAVLQRIASGSTDAGMRAAARAAAGRSGR
jgi:hypothetical protein